MERDQLADIFDIESARHDFDQAGHSSIRLKTSIEKKSFELFLICYRRSRGRYSIYDCLEYGLDTCTNFSRNIQNFLQIKVQLLQQLLFRSQNVCGLGVYLVNHRYDFEVSFKCFEKIRYCLCLNTFSAVDYQDRPFTSSYASRNLITKINMARCVYQVQQVFLFSLRVNVDHRCRLR